MAVCLSEMTNDRKIFLGDFDPVKIRRKEICFAQITSDLKLAALLYDRILIPAAYLWQSNMIGDKIPYFQDFIAAGILLPTVRTEDRDLQDRFEKRLEETDKFKNPQALARSPSLEGELTTEEHRQVLRRLRDQDNFVYLDKKTVSGCLRQLWEKDLYGTFELDVDTEALGTYVYENLPEEEARRVIDQLLFGKDLEYVSRTTLLGITQHCMDRAFGCGKWDQGRIERRISWLYLFATARAADCDLYVNGFDSSQSVSYANLGLYQRTLAGVQLTPELLQSFSAEDIIAIRRSKEYREFIRFYQELLNNARLVSDAEVQKVIQRLLRESKMERIRRMIPRIRSGKEKAFGIASGLVVNCVCGTPISLTISGAVGTYLLMECVSRMRNRTAVIDFQRYLEQNYLHRA